MSFYETNFEDQVVEYYQLDPLERACEIYYNPSSLGLYLASIHGRRNEVRGESEYAAEIMDYVDMLVLGVLDPVPDSLVDSLFD